MDPRPYKSTLFDRLGPDAGHRVIAISYGFMVFLVVFVLWAAVGHGFGILAFFIAVAAGASTSSFALLLGGGAGGAYNHLMAKGSTTPYVEQFSYQQALVMQGRVEDALASYEAVIAESPAQVTARIKAAELYLRDARNPARAFELLKQAQAVAAISPGEDVYVSNRLADLLAGPLGKPGAALVELRRLVDRHPDLPAAGHARDAIARIKGSLLAADESAS
jgi:tetratricopeptide (TPR) repeat protein